jgi:hypothetical protein
MARTLALARGGRSDVVLSRTKMMTKKAMKIRPPSERKPELMEIPSMAQTNLLALTISDGQGDIVRRKHASRVGRPCTD